MPARFEPRPLILLWPLLLLILLLLLQQHLRLQFPRQLLISLQLAARCACRRKCGQDKETEMRK